MKQTDTILSIHAGDSECTAAPEPTVDEVLRPYERSVMSRHLDAIGLGMVEAIANDEARYTYQGLSRDWSSAEFRNLLESALRDYVNFQQGWTCVAVLIDELDTGRQHPAHNDPHQRIVVIAERVNLP